MIKSLEQINREFIEECSLIKIETQPCMSTEEASACSGQAGQKRVEKRVKTCRRRTDILLYAVIVFVVLVTLIFNGNSDKRAGILGYTGFAVLSESMQSEIPEGALVIVKKVDPESINVGDDITFIRRKDEAAVTHRVVSVLEHYGERNDLSFQTQGIENSEPDQDIVYADDIVGAVWLIIPGLGATLHYISVNVGVVLIAVGGFFMIVIALRKTRCSIKK